MEDNARYKRNLERLSRMRLMDDTLMRCVFRDCLPLAEHVLRIVTGIDTLTLVRAETQRDLRRLVGARSVVLDVWGVDDKGVEYNLEVQAGPTPLPQRMRYHSAAMDIEVLAAGDSFDVLPEQWVIFIADGDPLGDGRGVSHFERRRAEDGRILGDGTHLLVVNGAYRGDDELGSLMADFSRSNPNAIADPLLRERVQYYKQSKEGVSHMCRIADEIYAEGVQDGIERGIEQGVEQGLVNSAKSLVYKLGISAQRALEILEVPEKDRPRILAML